MDRVWEDYNSTIRIDKIDIKIHNDSLQSTLCSSPLFVYEIIVKEFHCDIQLDFNNR
jgi:hypothetical protein